MDDSNCEIDLHFDVLFGQFSGWARRNHGSGRNLWNSERSSKNDGEYEQDISKLTLIIEQL